MLVLGRFDFFGLRDKKGLSNLIAYVLLIAISLSLSVMVYGWLKFYVGGAEVVECPGGVNVIIDSYECSSGSFTVTIKNKGLFDVDGYVLRFHNRSGAEFGVYVFDEDGKSLDPGERYSETYDLSSFNTADVTLADVQPFVNIKGKNVTCKSFSSQKINCN